MSRSLVYTVVGVGLLVAAFIEYGLMAFADLPVTIREARLLSARRAASDGTARTPSELNDATVALAEAIGAFIDGPLRQCRDEVQAELDLERGLLRGQTGALSSDTEAERFLRLGGLGLTLGQVNAAETCLRRLAEAIGRLSFDLAGDGSMPLARQTYAGAAILSVQARGLLAGLSEGWGATEEWEVGSSMIFSRFAELRALWERGSGARFNAGLPEGSFVSPASGAEMTNVEVNEIGERLFGTGGSQSSLDGGARGVDAAVVPSERAGGRQ